MIHHVSVGTNNVAQARAFYDAVMDVLGLRVLSADNESVDYGTSDIFFSIETPSDRQKASPGNGVHIAFKAMNRAMVRRFHAVALANGGKDAGAPGERPEYDAHYYGAFVCDPDGNKIEALTLTAE
jgi:catechol 2,3-dioxygenase-like lactoylglutathione lyase family enzyme